MSSLPPEATITMKIATLPYSPMQGGTDVTAEGPVELVSCLVGGGVQFVPVIRSAGKVYAIQLSPQTAYELPKGDRPQPDSIIWKPNANYSITGREVGTIALLSEEKPPVVAVSRIARSE